MLFIQKIPYAKINPRSLTFHHLSVPIKLSEIEFFLWKRTFEDSGIKREFATFSYENVKIESFILTNLLEADTKTEKEHHVRSDLHSRVFWTNYRS